MTTTPEPRQKRFLSLAAFSREVDLSEQTCRDMIDLGLIAATRTGTGFGGRFMVLASEVNRLVDEAMSNRRTAAQQAARSDRPRSGRAQRPARLRTRSDSGNPRRGQRRVQPQVVRRPPGRVRREAPRRPDR